MYLKYVPQAYVHYYDKLTPNSAEPDTELTSGDDLSSIVDLDSESVTFIL